jgi:DNA-binding Xre family transcriptional regulator
MSKRLSELGATCAELARTKKGYKKSGDRRLTEDIYVSPTTLKRFWDWRNYRISDDAFDDICSALGLDPETVMDRSVDEKKLQV